MAASSRRCGLLLGLAATTRALQAPARSSLAPRHQKRHASPADWPSALAEACDADYEEETMSVGSAAAKSRAISEVNAGETSRSSTSMSS